MSVSEDVFGRERCQLVKMCSGRERCQLVKMCSGRERCQLVKMCSGERTVSVSEDVFW